MKALVIASGAGDPAEHASAEGPAALPSITGTPAIIYMLAWLKCNGITHVAIAVHEEADAFVDLIGDGQTWGLTVEWARDAGVPGTAGVARQLGAFLDETFVVVHGHLLLDDGLSALLDYHNARDALLTIGLKHTGEPQTHTMVECASTGMVTRFVLRPATWASEQRTMAPGLYIAEPAVLAHVPNDRQFDWEEHLVPLLVAQREPVYAQLLDGQVADLRVPHVYEEVKATGVKSANYRRSDNDR